MRGLVVSFRIGMENRLRESLGTLGSYKKLKVPAQLRLLAPLRLERGKEACGTEAIVADFAGGQAVTRRAREPKALRTMITYGVDSIARYWISRRIDRTRAKNFQFQNHFGTSGRVPASCRIRGSLEIYHLWRLLYAVGRL